MKKNVISIISVIFSVFMLVPVFLIVTNAFTGGSDLWILLSDDLKEILPMFFRGIWGAALSSFFQTFFSVLGGYALIRKARNMKMLFPVLVFVMLIPFQVSFLPIYVLMKNIGLYGSIFSVVIVESLNPIGILFFSLFLKQIPAVYYDIIRLNSNRNTDVLRYIIFPYCRKASLFYSVIYFCKVWSTSEISDKLIGAVNDNTLVSHISMTYQSSPYTFQLCFMTLIPVLFGGLLFALLMKTNDK
ncbi:MAG: hypothetical protein E7477_01920 [Ruminococcaceae bacterium]|nr:hypothetical protein [Oscillospiraceae bacterium]